ncbi:MAG: aconitase family protein [Bdellovibrionales bacterium]
MTQIQSRNSLNAYQALVVDGQAYTYFSLKAAEQVLGDLSHLPCCMRIFLENLLRYEDDKTITQDDMRTLTAYHALHKNIPSIAFRPARFLIDDSAAVSTLTDIAALQEVLEKNNIDQTDLDVACPVDIIVRSSSETPAQKEERYSLIKWGEKTIGSLHLIPPGHGPGNYININALSPVIRVVADSSSDIPMVIPDTVLGMDTGFCAVNSLGVLGWQSDPLEIQSFLLGHSTQLTLPGVLGIKLTGKIHKSAYITDIAMFIAQTIGPTQAQGKIIEFYGPAMDHLSVPDRAVIATFMEETGALCSYFPIDAATLSHMTLSGHSAKQIALIETYAKEQGLWHESWPQDSQKDPSFTTLLEIALDGVRHCTSGPDTIYAPAPLTETASQFAKTNPQTTTILDPLATIRHGDIVLALLSAENTSAHPTELVIAGLVARKAAALGLRIKPWVKAILADLSPVTHTFLEKSGLAKEFETIGVSLPSGDERMLAPLWTIAENIQKTIRTNNLTVATVSSAPIKPESLSLGFDSPTYLSSMPIVLVYALAGTLLADMGTKPIGTSPQGKSVTLKDLWPTAQEIHAVIEGTPRGPICEAFKQTLDQGSDLWTKTQPPQTPTFPFSPESCLIKKPPYLEGVDLSLQTIKNVKDTRILAMLEDNVPAQWIAPMGKISPKSPAGYYLTSHAITVDDTQFFSLKTGHYDIMVRGGLTHPKLKNKLLPEGSETKGNTIHFPSGTNMTIFDAAERYATEGTQPILVGGQNMGHGTGQEWAAKILRLMKVPVVLAESFDPIFQANLVRVGIMPLQLKTGVTLTELQFTGEETISFAGLSDIDHIPAEAMMTIERKDGVDRYMVLCGLKTNEEIDIYRNGSLWACTLRKLA